MGGGGQVTLPVVHMDFLKYACSLLKFFDPEEGILEL